MNLIVYKNKPSLKQGFFVLGLIVIIVIWTRLLNFINYRCPIHELLDLYCPGCGGTRMFLSFIHLDFYQSFRWNPLLFIFLVLFIIYLIVGIIIFIKKRVIIVPTFKTCMFLVAILIIFMILRNIDMFSYLAPTRV